MARHDVNQSKTTRLLAKARNIGSFRTEPIVIPRNKLDLAHLKVKRAQDKNKYLIAAIVILTLALAVACFMLVRHQGGQASVAAPQGCQDGRRQQHLQP